MENLVRPSFFVKERFSIVFWKNTPAQRQDAEDHIVYSFPHIPGVTVIAKTADMITIQTAPHTRVAVQFNALDKAQQLPRTVLTDQNPAVSFSTRPPFDIIVVPIGRNGRASIFGHYGVIGDLS